MKIVAGKYKGRTLFFKKTKEVRPMTEKVRSAIYDILQDWIVDKKMLDLFCGSGSVGIEAISRSAAHVDFIDMDTRIVIENVENLGIGESVSIYRKDVFSALQIIKKKSKRYDFIFIGAPYTFEKIPEILKNVDDFGILNHKGLMILEHVKGLDLHYTFKSLFHVKTYTYGQTILELFESNV